MNDIIKLNQSQVFDKVIRYEVFGLNTFNLNVNKFPELKSVDRVPFYKFFDFFTAKYETVCLLGSPGPQNFKNDKYKKGINPKVSLEEYLRIEAKVHKVPIGLCSHTGFFDIKLQGYEPGLLFNLPGDRALEKLYDYFMPRDYVALLFYEQGRKGLNLAHKVFSAFSPEDEIIKSVFPEAKSMLLTKNDRMSLVIYSRDASIENDLLDCFNEAREFIEGSSWFKINKDRLQWNKEEMCYVIG